MRIIHIASEMARVAKVGGLGDVILGLSRQVANEGHTVEVILPKYTCLNYANIRDLHVLYRDLWSYGGGRWHHNTIWCGWAEGIKIYLIETHTPPHYFDREKVYGYQDDVERFTYFSRASLEFLLQAEIKPDIIHIHEWQTALVAPLYRDIFQPLGLGNASIVLTLHNLEHQGLCSTWDLDKIGIDGRAYCQPEKLQHLDHPNGLNLLKGGIIYSDAFTTVSPTYAEEVLTPEEGRGLDPLILAHQDKFTGIRNGLDYSLWGPSVDPLIPVAFGHDTASITNKRKCKAELRTRFALSQEDRPLVGAISRLVPQKGMELIKRAIFRTLEHGGQFVLLGTAPTKEIHEDFYALKVHFGDNPHVHLELHHHEELAHMIFAGADMFVVPSLFEPCGLTQLIALRYGTVPIVRRTGGLAETVHDIDDASAPKELRNGFAFDAPTFDLMDATLDRAMHCYKNESERWLSLMIHGMKMDFSWRKPSRHYLEIYEQLTKNATV